MSTLTYFDAHNHLQDSRLDPWRGAIVSELDKQPLIKMVVNGTHEGDWHAVAELARRYHWVLPSFGIHPWYLDRLTQNWKPTLEQYLDEFPYAVGEIGLDRWMTQPNIELQERIFTEQLEIAQERELPVSIHCLKAWGRLLELLTSAPLPKCGFLLHSYGGSAELIEPFARLGGYFSCSGYFLSERKRGQLETFKHAPSERLLIETDAPDQALPAELDRFALVDSSGRRLTHPASIAQVYEGVADVLEIDTSQLCSQTERNFRNLFGSP